MSVPEDLRGQSAELEDSDHEEKEKARIYRISDREPSTRAPKADLSELGLHC